MKRKAVITSVTHPRAVEIMNELEGKPVKVIYQHHESTTPQKQTYEITNEMEA